MNHLLGLAKTQQELLFIASLLAASPFGNKGGPETARLIREQLAHFRALPRHVDSYEGEEDECLRPTGATPPL